MPQDVDTRDSSRARRTRQDQSPVFTTSVRSLRRALCRRGAAVTAARLFALSLLLLQFTAIAPVQAAPLVQATTPGTTTPTTTPTATATATTTATSTPTGTATTTPTATATTTPVAQTSATPTATATAQATVTGPVPDEQDIVGPNGAVIGRHYRETGSGTGLGFDVREPFFTAFQALGGPNVAGYPVSIPFTGADGCTYQAFQVALLQACAGGSVQRANTFQIMEQTGVDAQLEQKGIARGESDNSTSFDQAKQIRLGWLEDNAIRAAYLSQCGNGDAEAAIQLCGLPMNHPGTIAPYPFVSQRFQRIAFQRWLSDGPAGIKAGDITRVLGSDLLKETGVLGGPAVQPHPLGQVPPPPVVTFATTSAPTQTLGASATPNAAPVGSTPAGRTTPLSYGFQGEFFNTAKRPQAIGLIKQAGFQWAKQQVIWNAYEISFADCILRPTNCDRVTINGRPKYFAKDQFGYLDAVVNDLSGAGLNVLLSVVKAPVFYAAPQSETPLDPQMLGDFTQYLTARYKGKIRAMEPWNEENLAGEWGGSRLWPLYPTPPPQGAVDFLQLQKAAYTGIKAADPTVIVVLPAPTPTGAPPPLAIDDRDYMDYLFQVNNGEIKQYYDVMGVHPSGYNNPPDDWVDKTTVPSTNFKGHPSFYIKRYQQLHDVQVKYGDTKPMWFTEVGWSSTRITIPGYDYGRDNTEDQRGKYFARLLEQVYNEAPYVTNVIVWNLNFRTTSPETDEKYGFGTINADGSATPSYVCLSDFVRSGNRITRPECRLS